MSDYVESSDLLDSCTTKPSEPSVQYANESSFSGYDADDEAVVASHVSESSIVDDADSNVPIDEVCSAPIFPEVAGPVEDEGFGDSEASPFVDATDAEAMGNLVPSEPLAEGDSSSFTSSPIRCGGSSSTYKSASSSCYG